MLARRPHPPLHPTVLVAAALLAVTGCAPAGQPADSGIPSACHGADDCCDAIDDTFARCGQMPPVGSALRGLTASGGSAGETGRLVLRLDGATRADAINIGARYGLELLDVLDPSDGQYVYRADPGAGPNAVASALAAEPGVRWAVAERERLLVLHGSRWLGGATQLGVGPEPARPGVRAQAAWATTRGRPEVRIAVFDDGIDELHPGLPVETLAVETPSADRVGARPGPLDDLLQHGFATHGTAVAGLVAGRTPDGPLGACPECTIVPIWHPTGFRAPLADTALAQIFLGVRDSDAWVMNNSWGMAAGRLGLYSPDRPAASLSPAVFDAIRSAARDGRGGRGAVIVFSAGNENSDVAGNAFATHPDVITVAAVSARGMKAWYANHGDAVWVAAPGGGRFDDGLSTTDVRGAAGYGDGPRVDGFGGTSAAAPVVAGIAGLVLATRPELTAAQVKDILRRTARVVDRMNGGWRPDAEGRLRSPYYGYGIVDAEAAVRAAVIGCQPGERARCTPARCDGFVSPDGLDADCDGVADADPPALDAPVCGACAAGASCGGGCEWPDGEAAPVCLALCVSDGDCPPNHACVGAVCLPDIGGCTPPPVETCDGRDEDRDGRVDEGVCARADVCEVDGQCGPGEACINRGCRPRCRPGTLCDGGAVCAVRTDDYGRPRDDGVCLPGAPPAPACGLETTDAQAARSCLAGPDCRSVVACLDRLLDR